MFFPAERKHSPTYVLLHTDPDKSVKHKGADFFWQWAHVSNRNKPCSLLLPPPLLPLPPPPLPLLPLPLLPLLLLPACKI